MLKRGWEEKYEKRNLRLGDEKKGEDEVSVIWTWKVRKSSLEISWG